MLVDIIQDTYKLRNVHFHTLWSHQLDSSLQKRTSWQEQAVVGWLKKSTDTPAPFLGIVERFVSSQEGEQT